MLWGRGGSFVRSLSKVLFTVEETMRKKLSRPWNKKLSWLSRSFSLCLLIHFSFSFYYYLSPPLTLFSYFTISVYPSVYLAFYVWLFSLYNSNFSHSYFCIFLLFSIKRLFLFFLSLSFLFSGNAKLTLFFSFIYFLWKKFREYSFWKSRHIGRP